MTMRRSVFYLDDDELRGLPAAVIAQLSRSARQRAALLKPLPRTDDMVTMPEDLERISHDRRNSKGVD
jgi:hypothetical protein